MQIMTPGMNCGYLKKKANSTKQKSHKKTRTPAVRESTMYQMMKLATIPKKVPITRQKKPKMDWPEAVIQSISTHIFLFGSKNTQRGLLF